MTSTAFPTARPSGACMAVMTASVRTPEARPVATSDSARRRESASVFMNAPLPVLTSSTSASMPSAIFLLMMDAVMSGMLSTVPVTSRRAYSFLSAGAISFVWPIIAQPTFASAAFISGSVRLTLNPGIASSLSSVPPVWPSPRPDIIGTGTPHAAASGARMSDVLSPTPPVLCLSTLMPGMSLRSTRTPEWTIASVNDAVSAAVMPRSRIAISSADAWYSGTAPDVTPSTMNAISSRSSVPPSRFLMMRSTARMQAGSILRESMSGPAGGAPECMRGVGVSCG